MSPAYKNLQSTVLGWEENQLNTWAQVYIFLGKLEIISKDWISFFKKSTVGFLYFIFFYKCGTFRKISPVYI